MQTKFPSLTARIQRMRSRMRREPQPPPEELALRNAYQNAFIGDLKNHVDIEGKKVLVIGCNRGLECELFRRHGAGEITGVDPGPGVGEDFPRPYIEYVNVAAEYMPFEDDTFDVVATFAALEHIPDPRAALRHMVRVTKKYGAVYCHGSLLWYSPFGHHQGSFFKDEPWIHIRRPTLEGLISYYGDVDQIVDGVALLHHLEYLTLSPEFNRVSATEYKRILVELLESTSPIRIMFDMNLSFRALMTSGITKELESHREEDLLTETATFILRKL